MAGCGGQQRNRFWLLADDQMGFQTFARRRAEKRVRVRAGVARLDLLDLARSHARMRSQSKKRTWSNTIDHGGAPLQAGGIAPPFPILLLF